MQHLEETVPWRKRPEVGNVDSLLALARDRSLAGRETLAAAVGDLFGAENGTLNETEHAIMHDILSKLVQDVETTVRQKLAQKLSRIDKAPHELILELANDQIEVSLPILQRSNVLQDSELIEIISGAEAL